MYKRVLTTRKTYAKLFTKWILYNIISWLHFVIAYEYWIGFVVISYAEQEQHNLVYILDVVCCGMLLQAIQL